MPPKGRRSLNMWNVCETCNCFISSKDLDSHTKECQKPSKDWSYGFIKDSTLYGFIEDIRDCDITTSFVEEIKNDLVLVSVSAMQCCEMEMGKPVLVDINETQFIKYAWPNREGSLTSIRLAKEGYAPLMEMSKESMVPVKVTKIKCSTPAKTINFKLFKPIEGFHHSDLLRETLNHRFKNKILFSGMKMTVPLYGKLIVIEIISILEVKPVELEQNLADLTLGNKFFLVTEETSWVFINEKSEQKLEERIITLNEVGGYTSIIADLKENIFSTLHTLNKALQSCCGILLYGAHGTGKTLIVQALAYESKANVVNIQSTDLCSKFYGETETRLKEAFKNAIVNAPSVIIMDNVENLCPRKGSDQDRRFIGALCSLFDSIQSKQIVVLGVTVQPDDIDPGLRRPGRLEREIEIPVPSPDDRNSILRSFCHEKSLEKTIEAVARATHGYVGADLASLWDKAWFKAIKCNRTDVAQEDLTWALTKVKPSAMREVLIQVPNVLWSDIGGQEDLKLKLQQAVEWPLKHPESFKRLGISPPSGVLMFGPPGCSKTMIAKALATESKLNFLSVKGSDIFSKWVGESEKAIRNFFKRARSVAPSVIFLDEVDAIGGERETGTSSGGGAVRERVLSQILTEMDGVQSLENVVIIAATNRPDRIDKALLRPGRLDRLLYVPLPNFDTRVQILRLQFLRTPTAECVSVDSLAAKMEGYSGAEVVAVCKEAALKALEENKEADVVRIEHFESALKIITPRTPHSLLKLYDDYINKYKF